MGYSLCAFQRKFPLQCGAAFAALAIFASCGDTTDRNPEGGGPPLAPVDSGPPTPPSPDASVPPQPLPDSGPQQPVDAGPPPVDAGPPNSDAGPPPDAGPVEPGPQIPELNPGWIGGACASDSACGYATGICFESNQGFPGGMCSEACTRTCPDQAGALNTVTFCVASPVAGVSGGVCVSRCDFAKSPTGCRPSYHCESRPRFNEASTTQEVCVPGDPPPPSSSCVADIRALGLGWVESPIADKSPSGYPNLTCHVQSAGKLSSPIHGVSFRYVSQSTPQPMTMACALAKAVEKLAAHLATLDIVEVQHIGTYNCRIINGSNPAQLSQHGNGLAIDLAAFKHRDGTVFNVETDYEEGNSNPTSRAGKFLYDLSRWMYSQRAFNIILTPDFNAAHRNHFHVDLTPGAHFLRKDGVTVSEPEAFIGPNHGH